MTRLPIYEPGPSPVAMTMSTLTKFWTASIAYVALAVGAGLSIMYNVVDTMQVRGIELDVYDVITAVAAPAIVVLMVEMFVSRIWVHQPWYIQVVRWMATVAIGGVAMRTSWTHGHDFMLSRGQKTDVANLWPLAIDLLAIMATALILAGRRGQLATGQSVGQRVANVVDTLATGQDPDGHVATALDNFMATYVDGHVATGQTVATPEDDPLSEEAFRKAMATDWDADLAQWEQGVAMAIQDSGHELADEAERYVAEAAGQALPQRRPTPAPADYLAVYKSVPVEARELLVNWDGRTHTGAEVDELLAAHFGKGTRTVRRWRSAVLGSTSAPPSD
jgi:hypothetical protein